MKLATTLNHFPFRHFGVSGEHCVTLRGSCYCNGEASRINLHFELKFINTKSTSSAVTAVLAIASSSKPFNMFQKTDEQKTKRNEQRKKNPAAAKILVHNECERKVEQKPSLAHHRSTYQVLSMDKQSRRSTNDRYCLVRTKSGKFIEFISEIGVCFLSSLSVEMSSDFDRTRFKPNTTCSLFFATHNNKYSRSLWPREWAVVKKCLQKMEIVNQT